jgi:hypothetical protein
MARRLAMAVFALTRNQEGANVKTDQMAHPTIDPGLCTVEYACGPGGTGIAIWVYEKGECWVMCHGAFAPIPLAERPHLSLETRVSVQVMDVDRVQLGEYLAQLCETELFIPVAAASEKVTLSIEDTTLGDAIARAGLVFGQAVSIE